MRINYSNFIPFAIVSFIIGPSFCSQIYLDSSSPLEQVREDFTTEGIQDDTTTVLPPKAATESKLDWKVVPWIYPPIIWNNLGFPTAPTEDDVLAYPYDEELTSPLSNPDLSHYNVEAEDGVIKGTLDCECGVPVGRIFGDSKEPARINDIPWTAAMIDKSIQQPFCGSSLINDRYLVTAAHCLRGKTASDIEIWLNDESALLSHATIEKRHVYQVEELIVHPKNKVFYNDIALVKLKEPIPLGQGQFYLLNPVCLPKDNEEKFGKRQGTVAGWGKASINGTFSPILYKIAVPIHSNEYCINASRYRNGIKPNMLCAGCMEGGCDACQGDSGGPLIVMEDNLAKLVGIVSWGWGCAEPGAPGVYARVGVFPKWILENTKDAQWCQVKKSKTKAIEGE